jgi:hypothetical protein
MAIQINNTTVIDDSRNIQNIGVATFTSVRSTNINATGVSTFTSVRSTNINATGVTTSSGGFVGSLTGNATGLSGTPNITVGNINSSGIVTATSFSGDGTNLNLSNNNTTPVTKFTPVNFVLG